MCCSIHTKARGQLGGLLVPSTVCVLEIELSLGVKYIYLLSLLSVPKTG